jgi:hypothetical protein
VAATAVERWGGDGDDEAHVHARISPAGVGPVRLAARGPWPEVGRGGLSIRRGQPVLRVGHHLLRHGRRHHHCASWCPTPVGVFSPRGVSKSSSEVLADAASTSRWRSKKWRRHRFLGPPRPARRQRGRVVQPAKNDQSKMR